MRSTQDNEKNRNEPARFFGDGVMFKAKLIGILEVGEARGDRMCQEALQDLKMAIRAAGEHKQRITIHVTIDGLRLRDEKTGDSLYHHPVHKISFIAQDMTDSRAFGYIFGSPDSGHRFFGIKTDKAASQVVLAMRDLFQVVFELKKKEIELARQHIQNKITSHEHQQVALAVKNSILSASYKNVSTEAIKTAGATAAKAEKSPESVADLVDLEQELSSIQRGITQMERITPLSEGPPSIKNVLDSDDPFGDSFTSFPSILPPPESSKRHQKKEQQQSQKTEDPIAELSSIITSSTPPIPFIDGPSSSAGTNGRNWMNSPPISSVFEESGKFQEEFSPPQRQSSQEDKERERREEQQAIIDAFTDLDPLGTGKTKPYIDKKFFFQDLKNPPKKVLKDLSSSGQDSVFDVTFFGESNASSEPPSQPVRSSNIISIESSLLSRADNVEETKKDPFEEAEFTKFSSDPFDALFAASAKKEAKVQQEETGGKEKLEEKKSNDSGSGSTGSGVFNGPLQVSLPPESWSGSFNSQKRLERQNSDGSSPASNSSTSRSRPNVFKQNTVDVFSKKMKPPNLFGQKFTKRDSNGINMRRLQESDSLSETETAEPPMPPPRPDYTSHIEPPPLPPKKQFNDNFVIRPTSIPASSSSSITRDSSRYDYVSSKIRQQNENAPPLPLPSRRVGRTETSFPGPGRPKKSGEDDDYLTPVQGQDIPTILPPPQQKKDPKRGPRKSDTDPKNLDAPTPPVSAKPTTEIPDITLSQLLTLGIDDLASKLGVPVSKLNTMTLVQLTTYLSEFIEKSKQKFQPETPNDSPVFKVNFEENNATFVAKFDDNFGQDEEFVANFENFNTQPVGIPSNSVRSFVTPPAVSNIPTEDRYAVFREIIEQELKQSESIDEPTDSSLDLQKEVECEMTRLSPRPGSASMEQFSSSPLTLPATRIDTRLTDAISQAKDRYAALRDIIQVENLFDRSIVLPSQASMPESNISDETVDENQEMFGYENVQPADFQNSSPTINISESVDKEETEEELPEIEEKAPQNFLSTSNKDDFEIDEYMQKAISNLSLDSKDRLSPAVNKSPAPAISPGPGTAISPSPIPKISTPISVTSQKSPIDSLLADKPLTIFSDMSTSPIPPSKSPIPIPKPESSSKSPTPMPEIKEVVGFSDEEREKTATPPAEQKEAVKPGESDSWACFDQTEKEADKKEHSTTPTNKPVIPGQTQSPQIPQNQNQGPAKEAPAPESPYSSDGKNEWKQKEFPQSKRWPKGQTSSSSRDVSPWDEDGPPPDYRRRVPHHALHSQHHSADRYARPAPPIGRHHQRRINSCDEDYEYEDEIMDRRTRNRISKGPMHRSKEMLDSEHPGWYGSEHHQWSPAEDEEERMRSFDRNAYERSTYGPPYEKRGPYDRRDYKAYPDKRKYYRRDYDYDPYLEREGPYDAPPPPRGGKPRKEYDDYEGNFERGSRESRSARDYFYDRERKSFDRDSNESYDSGRGRRSMGSGELYGSFEGRVSDYRGDRDRFMAQTRSLRKGQRPRSRNEEDQDSDGEIVAIPRRPVGSVDTGSLQRGSTAGGPDKRQKPLQIPLDDEVWGNKPWKRPASATEPERGRYPLDQRRNVMQNPLSGSDGEKDKRFKKKPRGKGKDVELRSNYATIRYSQQQRRDYYEYEDDHTEPDDQETTSPRIPHEQEAYYPRRSHFKSTTPRSETRSFSESLKTSRYGYEDDDEDYDDPKSVDGSRRGFKKSSSREMYLDDPKERFTGKFGSTQFDDENDPPAPPPAPSKTVRNFPDYQNQPSKFNFDDGNGFESDFNSPPKPQPQSHSQLQQPQQPKQFRFSNDFSDKESPRQRPGVQQKPVNCNFAVDFSIAANNSNSASSINSGNGSAEATTTNTQQKLRFNENVSVSKFDADFSSQQMFEDDFSKSDLTFEAEDQWNPELPTSAGAAPTIQSSMKKLNSNLKSRQENIKKSESVNIFSRKVEDPFEDDEFFSSSQGQQGNGSRNGGKNGVQDPFQWNKNNFANFDDNI